MQKVGTPRFGRIQTLVRVRFTECAVKLHIRFTGCAVKVHRVAQEAQGNRQEAQGNRQEAQGSPVRLQQPNLARSWAGGTLSGMWDDP